jgi:hypothetical protein
MFYIEEDEGILAFGDIVRDNAATVAALRSSAHTNFQVFK